MSLNDYFLALRKQWLVIVALTILGALLGYAYAQTQPEVYRAQAAVVVIPARGDSTAELVQGSSYVQSLVRTYALVATSPVVLDPVIDRLGLSITPRALANQVVVETPLDSAVLTIAVTGGSPAGITAIADEIAVELADAVEALSPQTSASGPAVRIETISPATQPRVAIAPNTRLLIVAGALGGLVIGLVYAWLRRLLATRLQSRDDVASVTETPVLGEVTSVAHGSTLPDAVRRAETGLAAESVRGVAAGLRFANVDGDTGVILVTSATSGEGKSSVALSTALILAEQGQRILLIDADLRRGSIAEMTGLEGGVGVTTILVGDIELADAIQHWGTSNLSVLTSGTIPPNPGQLLTSDHLRQLVTAARDRFDIVVIDSPPVLAVSDPLWLAPVADGILVVARYRFTKRQSLRRTLDELESTRTRILGIVLNAVKRIDSSPYYDKAHQPSTSWRWSRKSKRRE
ncbi:polysaccharide biosynthesis tyrosine autokinase [Microbacterium terricola]|uniref:Capsular exopolysaccharide biosynthesis protein n=1 Tax=Microbacterium terricola TaxID=344163 RepID=A0ABM8DV95_9MICO|nr:polysaccharide biosynthesis tyrosine autokinase [Microbacterium terricola]UYK39727.1 polysaccharide biosynthesis tyrosine autokinase [Microbacterium terricola]BDV29525.1 capsular exopolysaccharide biosynthesis protein [Microbacterium terricola]